MLNSNSLFYLPPSPFVLINMEKLDLSSITSTYIEGIYSKIYNAYARSATILFFNWNWAGIEIPPSYVEITYDDTDIIINDAIRITSDDVISYISPTIVIEPLTADENGIYRVTEGIDGFNPVTVNVAHPQPVLVSLSVTENGDYTPQVGEDGFSAVSVRVPYPQPILVSLEATENGVYTPEAGVDGYNQVDVNVPPTTYPLINYEARGTLKSLSEFNLYGLNANTDRIRLLGTTGNPLVINWSSPFHIKLVLSVTLLNRTQVIFGSDEQYYGAPAIHIGGTSFGNIWFAASSAGSSWTVSLNFSSTDLAGFIWGNEFELDYIFDGSKITASVTQGELYVYKEVEINTIYSNNYAPVIGWAYNTTYSATTMHFYAAKSFIKSNGVLVWGAE